MRRNALVLIYGLLLSVVVACVDPEELFTRGTANIIVVDGIITNLPEPMVIHLNESRVDQTLGRSSMFPITKAKVEVIVDSADVIACHETMDGEYQLPSDFRGYVGHAYQLRFTRSNGTTYRSTQQVMQPVPAISRVTAQFNPTSVLPLIDENYTGGYDLFADIQDPAEVRNYYRWDWTLFEPQDWCRSCYEGVYAVNAIKLLNSTYQSTDEPFESCFYPPVGSQVYLQLRQNYYDYPCKTQCWEIIHKQDDIAIFSDEYSNGGLITHRPVAHIPYYQNRPCIVHIRQGSLTKDAYNYFNRFQQQTQKTGGLADTPPTALVGNIQNLDNDQEGVIGYFTASAMFVQPYYIDRKDSQGIPPGLFYSLNGRKPRPEPQPPYSLMFIVNGPPRPPMAVCAPAELLLNLQAGPIDSRRYLLGTEFSGVYATNKHGWVVQRFNSNPKT